MTQVGLLLSGQTSNREFTSSRDLFTSLNSEIPTSEQSGTGRSILRNAESCQWVICGKFDADFFCGMMGKVRNESMRNVTEMNITKYSP